MRRSLITLVVLFGSLPLSAQSLFRVQRFCEEGGYTVTTQGLASTTHVQRSFPRCTVNVYLTGTTTLATIFSDNLATPTPLANPFTGNTDGSFGFYADTASCYDVVTSGGNPGDQLPSPFTYSNICQGGSGGGGGGGPTITCPGAVNGGLAAWLSPTALGCDNNSLTDFLGHLSSQSYQAVGPHNGEVWLTTDGVVSPDALPSGTIGLVVPNVVSTPFRINLPPTVGSVGQVLQKISGSTDATGTLNVFLDWLTPSSGGTSNFVYEIPSGVTNGSNVTFTLSQTPSPGSTLMLWRNGQLQGASGVDYTLSTATITFNVAPLTSDLLYAFYGTGATVAGNAVLSVFGRTGSVVAANNDYSVGQVLNAAKVQTCTNQFLKAVDSVATAGNCKSVDTADVSSNAITTALLAASAVTTAKINDGSVTLVKEASNTANTLRGYDGSGNAADVTIGSNLTLTGGVLAASGGGSGAMVQVETHTASSSASLAFTTCFSSTYHNYVIKGNLVVPATNAVNMTLTFNSDSSAIYDYSTLRWNSGGTQAGGTTGATALRINAADATLSNDAHYGLNFTYNLTDPNSTGAYKHLYGQAQNAGNDALQFQGTYKSTSAVTRFDVQMSSGNIASGVITCYGITP